MSRSRNSKRKQRDRAGKRRGGGGGQIDPCADDAYEGWINHDWRDLGTAGIVVVRPGRDDTLVVVSFILDRLCLGIEEADGRVGLTRAEVETEMIGPLREKMELMAIDIESIRDLVAGAIRFGRRHGFRPPRGHQRWARLIGIDRDRIERADMSAFGRGDRLVFMGTERELRRRLAGQTIGEFLARPDVDVQFIDEDELAFEEQFESEEQIAEAAEKAVLVRAVGIAGKVESWCRSLGEEPNAQLGLACTFQLLGIMNAAEDPEALKPEDLARSRVVVEGFLDSCNDVMRPDVERALEQVERDLRTFQDHAGLIQALCLDEMPTIIEEATPPEPPVPTLRLVPEVARPRLGRQ